MLMSLCLYESNFMYVLYNMTGIQIVNCGIDCIIRVRNSVASGFSQNNKFS